MEKVFTPFTDEQVKLLNEYQQLGIGHPFTCSGIPTPLPAGTTDSEGNDVAGKLENSRQSCENEGILIATNEGWICPCGKYKQHWAHEHMLDIESMGNTPFGKMVLENEKKTK